MTNGLDLNIQHCRFLACGWALVLVLRWRPLALKGPPSLGSFSIGHLWVLAVGREREYNDGSISGM